MDYEAKVRPMTGLILGLRPASEKRRYKALNVRLVDVMPVIATLDACDKQFINSWC